MPGVEHIPVVQIDLSVPLKVPGKYLHGRGELGEPVSRGWGPSVVPGYCQGPAFPASALPLPPPWLE